MHQRHQRDVGVLHQRGLDRRCPVRREVAHQLLAELRTRDRRQVARSRFILPVHTFARPDGRRLAVARTNEATVDHDIATAVEANQCPRDRESFRRPLPQHLGRRFQLLLGRVERFAQLLFGEFEFLGVEVTLVLVPVIRLCMGALLGGELLDQRSLFGARFAPLLVRAAVDAPRGRVGVERAFHP